MHRKIEQNRQIVATAQNLTYPHFQSVIRFLTLLRFKFQNAAEFGNYLRFSISTVCGPKISRRTRQYSLATEMS